MNPASPAFWGVIAAVCLVGAFLLIIRSNIEQQKEAAEEKAKAAEEEAKVAALIAEAEKKKQIFDATHNTLELEVGGVTADNRQLTLSQLYHKFFQYKFITPHTTIALDPYEIDGHIEIHVLFDDEIIGRIKKKDVDQVMEIMSRIEDMKLNIDYFKDENTRKTIYYADLTIIWPK